MGWKLQHQHCLIALTLALAAAAACGDEDSPPATMMDTDSNQPSGGSSNGGTDDLDPAANMGGMPGSGGSSGANGAGEAPGMDAPIDMGEAGSANSDGSGGTGNGAGGANMDPACTTGAADSDGDGVSDCLDACAQNPNKLEAGVCGCDVLDTDIDFDGALDCQETCPGDPGKTEPGACGCGSPDIDSDTDGTLDCNDGCAFDGARIAPSACGCGADDTLALCLQHRYSFNGMGVVAADGVGDADGDILGGAALSGNGTLVLAGGITDQFVDLPAGIISRLGANATIETWVAWTGAGAPWQRIFDFGSSELAPGTQGTGVTYLFLTPSNTINTDLRVAYTNAGPPAERVVNALTPLPFPQEVHLAVVIDGAAATLTLYQNGALVGTAPTLDTTLPLLNDVNNWLGRSQFQPDEEFQGTLNEVRIYSAARSAAQIDASFDAGPNALPAQ